MSRERVADAIARVRDNAIRKEQVEELGTFFKKLARWSWFVTITSRFDVDDDHKKPRRISPERVRKFLAMLQAASGTPVGWVVAWAFDGSQNFHCHVLVSGVENLQIGEWCRRAYRFLGNTEIARYDDEQACPFYLAQNALWDGGDWEVGGSLESRADPQGSG
jgi:hypothetical protein